MKIILNFSIPLRVIDINILTLDIIFGRMSAIDPILVKNRE
jgi:hypothetical protein